MATRSFISKLLPDGSVEGVYCHWDGDTVGDVLKAHYTDPKKVDELLALGDISSLGPEIGQKHDFDNPTPGYTVAYHRDRGEDMRFVTTYPSVSAMRAKVTNDIYAEYAYVFDGQAWEAYRL